MSNTPTYPAKSLSVTATGVALSLSPCYLDSYFAYNSAATVLWLKFYDVATAAEATSSATPFWTIGIPATSGANLAGIGMRCKNGLSVRCVTGVADNNNTGAGANEMVVSVGLK